MGDRYFLKLNCAWCGRVNPDDDDPYDPYSGVMYAESCGITDFKCDFCGKMNDIVQDFMAVKAKPQ